MRHINPVKAGLSVGAVIGLYHLLWVSLVALGWAKPVLDFVLKLHFIQLQYDLAPFVIGTAALLVAITFGVGFLFGLVFACVWNWLGASGATTAPSAARVG
jgi:hypothetical protein